MQAIQQNKSLGQIDPGLFVEIEAEKDFQIGDLTIHPISVSHDAADPVAYRVNSSDKSVAVLTDLGCFDSHIIESMQNLDAILLEANHDVNMLQVGGYPYQLKMRILGERGHLSNELSGQLLCELLHDNMKYVLLGHLSNENNFPDLALKAVKMEVTLGDNPYKASDFQIEVASRSNISERIIV